MAVTISGFLVGFIISSAVIASLGMVMVAMNDQFPFEGYNASDFESLHASDDLQDLTEEIHDTTLNASPRDPSVLDVIGDYVTGGFTVLRISAKSMDSFDDVTTAGTESLDAGPIGDVMKLAIIATVVILLFIGVIVSAFLKWRT